MPRSSLVTRAEKTFDSSPWALPGALIGAYALTRLPLGLLTGLAIGFAAGWTLRSEQGAGSGHRRIRSEDDQLPANEDEKVDAMVDDSFPASDPPSYTPTRAGKPKKGNA